MANIEIITLAQAVETIKTAILQSQARAARNVSANQLALYFSVGGYISLNTRQQQWGSGAIETISERLQKELPGLQGFSASSIRNMRQFYETWHDIVIQQPLAGEIQPSEKQQDIIQQPTAGEIKSPVATQLQLVPSRLDFSQDVFDVEMAHEFLSISFTHHMEILFKTETLEQRLFYIQKTAEFNWNKYELRDQLKKGKFKPTYLGQLQSYLQILDTDIRKPNENPSIGIILCREANKAYVEFVIQKYDSPMGVATYKTAADMPEELRKALPDEQQLKDLLSGAEE